jgi:hypothetical protein
VREIRALRSMRRGLETESSDHRASSRPYHPTMARDIGKVKLVEKEIKNLNHGQRSPHSCLLSITRTRC